MTPNASGSSQIKHHPTRHMLSAWWLHLMFILGQYAIWPGVIEQFLVVTNNIITLG